MIVLLVALAPVLVLWRPSPSEAQNEIVELLKRQMAEMQANMNKMAERIEQLERERASANSKVASVEKSLQASRSAPSALNPAIGMAIDATAEHRAKTGGDFNFRAAEIGISASIDPYARGYAFFTGSGRRFEVEEAAIVTTSLPWNMQVRAGRFFADFGRLAKFHPHEYAFVNTPLSLERIVGGESKADGVELNYLFPTPFFLRATVGGYNKLGAENERLDDTKSRAWSRFTYLGRLQTYFDLADNHSIELGSSLAFTPSIRIPSDPKAAIGLQRRRLDLSLSALGQHALSRRHFGRRIFRQQRAGRARFRISPHVCPRRLRLRRSKAQSRVGRGVSLRQRAESGQPRQKDHRLLSIHHLEPERI